MSKIKKNIVLIETVENIGTGIMYPCSYDKYDYKYNCNSYIVFTNRHILCEIEEKCEAGRDLKNCILLQIFDDNGEKISDESIERVEIFIEPNYMESHEDIAALLVLIDKNISINLETRIYQEELEERERVYMEGYPGVMLDDEISQKVQLEGMIKKIFPANKFIGVYQINDDYHYYNNYKDLKLMEGFSGGPVYKSIGNDTFILGMNQSVANIESGENPFKLVYYLKIQCILDYLREKGCIIYGKIDEHVYHIEWIYDLHEEIKTYENKPTFLLLGGSGAGKSSFASDFALHKENFCATNDGQTTRTNVIYDLSIFDERNFAEIEFMSKEEFHRKIKRANSLKPVLFIYHKLLGFQNYNKNLNSYTYLENIYYLVKCICYNMKYDKKRKRTKKILHSLEEILLLRKNYDGEKLSDIYIEGLEILIRNIPLEQIKYICDRDMLIKIHEIVTSKKKYTELFNAKGREIDNLNDFHKIIKEIWKGEINREIEKVLFEECMKDEFNFKRYQLKCYNAVKQECVKKENLGIEENFKKENIMRELYITIINVDGFFNTTEFESFLSTKELYEELETLEESVIIDAKDTIKLNIDNVFKEVCEKIYDKLTSTIKKKLEIKSNSFEINLKETTKEEKKLLTMCLQVKNNKSLTGIIKSVKIHDNISNEYALLMKELEISKLTVLDTYGLDHVEWEAGSEYALQEIIYQYKSDKSIPLDDIGVLYIKKLDSGRPNELKKILPYVYKIIPQAPVYCVFSGIDILYSGNEKQIANINWSKENVLNSPKSIQYILSDKGRDEIINNIRCSEERKLNFYLVLKNNLIAYCGRKDLIKLKYEYYENNIKQIRKLIKSMIMKEFSSLEIVDIDDVDNVLKSKQGKEKVIKLLGKVFEKASISAWEKFHWKTAEANHSRIEKGATLGFWGVNFHRWYQLFHKAYTYVMAEENSELLEEFKYGKDAIEAALINMETKFLGNSDNLYKIDLKESEKNGFRKALEEMYQLYVYTNNPFKPFKENEDNLEKEIKSNLSNKREYLNDVVDFLKGFNASEKIREEFYDYFKETLISQIKDDNQAKSKNLINLNTSFFKELKALESEFIIKYNNKGNDDAKSKFNMLLNYYFKDNQ
ncbi:hypothetical protein [Oceanirhabdus sp. W0125-5]|uniref:hypothetical protein n=1 Tax=Oceanirhabdus sp. W0125-5 TaxID=2999116 RepID=UPI0022F32B57|nr:hypothetical protein [Oceanirhabdus sp. W0125-5]WBW98849.1 hypothetical protein OW730_08935 [Oceanirhabdus sp. W0125-5]